MIIKCKLTWCDISSIVPGTIVFIIHHHTNGPTESHGCFAKSFDTISSSSLNSIGVTVRLKMHDYHSELPPILTRTRINLFLIQNKLIYYYAIFFLVNFLVTIETFPYRDGQ